MSSGFAVPEEVFMNKKKLYNFPVLSKQSIKSADKSETGIIIAIFSMITPRAWYHKNISEM